MSAAPAPRSAAAEDPQEEEAEIPGGALPDVIYLPDQPQPKPPPKRGQHTGRMKGRHFGPRPVDDPRTKRIFVRMTPAQITALKSAAQEAGLSVSAFVCLRTLGDTGPRPQRRKPGPDMILLTQVKAGQGRIGGNLAQIVKRLNAYDFRGIPELLALLELAETTFTEHREASAMNMRALGGRSVTG